MRMWSTLYRHHRIEKHLTTQGADRHECLELMAKTWDLSQPIFLPKHEKEWEDYKHTFFAPSDFIEPFPYDKLEIRDISEDAPPAKRPIYADL